MNRIKYFINPREEGHMENMMVLTYKPIATKDLLDKLESFHNNLVQAINDKFLKESQNSQGNLTQLQETLISLADAYLLSYSELIASAKYDFDIGILNAIGFKIPSPPEKSNELDSNLSDGQKLYYTKLMEFCSGILADIINNKPFNEMWDEHKAALPVKIDSISNNQQWNVEKKLMAAIAISIAIGVILGTVGALLTWYIGGVGAVAGTALGAVIANAIAVKLGVSAILTGMISSKIGLAVTSGGIIAAVSGFFAIFTSGPTVAIHDDYKCKEITEENKCIMEDYNATYELASQKRVQEIRAPFLPEGSDVPPRSQENNPLMFFGTLIVQPQLERQDTQYIKINEIRSTESLVDQSNKGGNNNNGDLNISSLFEEDSTGNFTHPLGSPK